MKNRGALRVVPLIVVLITCFNPGRSVLAEEAKQPGSDDTVYIIKKGDTLWDISEEYLKNPFLWPDIWGKNRYIKNPDLIYPRNKLIIPYVIPYAPESGGVEAPLTATGGTISAPSAPPVPEMVISAPAPPSPPPPPSSFPPPSFPPPPSEELELSILQPPAPAVIGADLIYASGFITDSIESSGIISGSPEGRNMFATGDSVNITLQNKEGEVSVGDRFTIFRMPVYVVHPKTGKRVGMLFIPAGVLEIYRVQGKDAAGRIITSYSYSSPGDYIQPYRPASPVTEIVPTVPGIYGYIVGSLAGKMLNAEYNIVYIDLGASDGITPGTVFYVIGKRHADIIGELKVISVQAATSTALVTKSVEPFSTGSKIVTPAK